jgi:transposase InsO family protein
MPWLETTIVDERAEFCQLAQQEGANVSALCRRFGIGRTTAYKWLGRLTAGDGLADQSRRPHTSPGQTAPAVEAQLLALRRAHPTWGGRKLRWRLRDLGVTDVPAASTITALLRRHGLLDLAESTKHTAWTRFEADAANDLWQLDFKGHVPLATGRGRCHPLVLLDDHSRLVLGLEACADERTTTVQPLLIALFRRYGLPWTLLCDHGAPWASIQAESRLTELAAWIIRLGITLIHGRPRHPQTQGKLERVNRTLAAEVLAIPRYPDLASCQTAFDVWRTTYNLERPHEALDGDTPISHYRLSSRLYPETLPELTYEPGDLVRRVQSKGVIHLGNRKHLVSDALIGQDVAARPTDVDGRFELFYAHQRLRTLDLRNPPE